MDLVSQRDAQQDREVGMLEQFRQRFWQPPRAHGEAEVGRTVSFLELFYDLVYVVVIARAAHTLAEHLTWQGVIEFAAVFGLIWIAWVNGTLYYDLHGRQDLRTRVFVFGQMLLLALLAVFTADAAGEDGAAFAVVFATYMAVLGWLWYTVRRQDSDEYSTITFRYLSGMVLSVVIIGFSAFLDADSRMIVWLVFTAAWLVGSIVVGLTSFGDVAESFAPSESMVERFGLFIIIVLGEVVVGAVTGMSDAERTALTITTGMLGLMIGLAFWWTYFDFVGKRLPRAGQRSSFSGCTATSRSRCRSLRPAQRSSASSSTPMTSEHLLRRRGCCVDPWPSGCAQS